MEAGAELSATKSAIAGKQSESFGQTTTTAGVPQSGPCVQPSKLITTQETVEKKCQRRGPLTGTPVSPRHDAPLCGPAPLLRSPLPQISIILQQRSPFARLASNVTTACTLREHRKSRDGVRVRNIPLVPGLYFWSSTLVATMKNEANFVLFSVASRAGHL